MSAESDASGGFWRGFFTGVFLLSIGTVALIVFFPLENAETAPTAITPPEPASDPSDTGITNGALDGGETLDDAAASNVAEENNAELATAVPTISLAVEEPVSALRGDDAPIAPSQRDASSVPSTLDAANLAADQPELVPRTDSSVDPSVSRVPATKIAVATPALPAVNGQKSRLPVIAAQDTAPVDPQVSPRAGAAAAVERAPSVLAGGTEVPSAPASGTDVATLVPGENGAELSEAAPAVRIAAQAQPSGSLGTSVGNSLGTAARTFVGALSLSDAPAEASGGAANLPGPDNGEIKTAMAPAAEAPDTGDDVAVVDTSTSAKPRLRPEPPLADGPAFEAFAAKFNDTGEKPLLAIILQDVGADGVDRENLLLFGFPVTYAVAIDDPDAPWSEASYRESGFEVLAMVPRDGSAAIVRGQSADRLAAQLAEYFSAVPGAIGLLDSVNGEIQRDNNLVKALISELKPGGYALLVNKGSGFSSVVDLAGLQDVPSASVARIIDKKRDPASIRANLDRAALLASKTGSAVVVGRTYPETVTTLVRWLLGSTARSLTIAPVSAAIKR